MTQIRTKQTLDNIWKRYEQTLKLLLHTQNQLDQKQKEIVRERLHVNTINLVGDQAAEYEKRIQELEAKIERLTNTEPTSAPGTDYWGRPKSSKKETSENSYEAAVEKRFKGLMKQVKAKTIDINTLTEQDQQVIRQMLEDE